MVHLVSAGVLDDAFVRSQPADPVELLVGTPQEVDVRNNLTRWSVNMSFSFPRYPGIPANFIDVFYVGAFACTNRGSERNYTIFSPNATVGYG